MDKGVVSCGVLQGSVLGPLLFLLYVNDIQHCSRKLKFFLFAGDANVLYSHENLKSLELIVNAELNNIFNWLNSNKLALNIKKTNFVIFRPHQKKNLITYPRLISLLMKKIRVLLLNIRTALNFLGY